MRDVSAVPVNVYANAESVELFVNGASQGRFTSAGRRFEWSGVALLEGENEIRASATKNGMVSTPRPMFSTVPSEIEFSSIRYRFNISRKRQ